MKTLDVITFILLVIGGLNWGILGAINVNVVGSLCGGDMTNAARIVYCVVGLCAIYEVLSLPFISRRWHMERDHRGFNV